MKQLLDVAGSSKHLLGARPYAHVFGEIFPAHSPRAVDQELCGTRDVMAVGASPGVQQTVPPDYVQIGIGQQREGEARLVLQVARDLRAIHADGYRTNAPRLEFLKVLLNAS
jgi:hypothetical protein